MAFLDQRDRDLRALLEITRPITPEELAELQLEQGYADRALSIYDELAEREPANTAYATRRAWLARIVARSSTPRRSPPASVGPLDSRKGARRGRSASGTEQTGPLQVPSQAPERALDGVGPTSEQRPEVRALPILDVR